MFCLELERFTHSVPRGKSKLHVHIIIVLTPGNRSTTLSPFVVQNFGLTKYSKYGCVQQNFFC